MEPGRFFAAARLRMTMVEACMGEHEVRPYGGLLAISSRLQPTSF